jgi:electron transport complex protein RnfG
MSLEAPTSLIASIRTGAISLGIFAVLTAAAISLTYVAGSDSIAANKAAAKARALSAVIPPHLYDQSLLSSPRKLVDYAQLNLSSEAIGYAAVKANETLAIVLPVIAKDGYSGDISLLVGIDQHGVIQGVRTIEHRETPGLGDKVERKKSPWVDSFNGRSLTNTPLDDWAVIKDGGVFDGFTGATITPRAVVNAVHQGLLYHQQQHNALYSPLDSDTQEN